MAEQLTRWRPVDRMEGQGLIRLDRESDTHAVTNNSRDGRVVGREELRVREVRGVQILQIFIS